MKMNCQRCKRRKIRCDKARPKCGTCARLNGVCEYGILHILLTDSDFKDVGLQKRGGKDDQIAELIRVLPSKSWLIDSELRGWRKPSVKVPIQGLRSNHQCQWNNYTFISQMN